MNKKVLKMSVCIYLVTILGCGFLHCQYPNVKEVHDTIIVHDTVYRTPSFYHKTPKEGLRSALAYYGVKHPDIVYAQAVLETGHFTSKGCTKDNNLFGIKNSKGRHAKYGHWVESVKAYKNRVQYKHKKNENYFAFLKRIGYAEDPEYIVKLKRIQNRL